VHAELHAEKNQIHLTAFSADDGKKGKMSAEGTLNLAPDFPFYLTAELAAFRALHFNPLDCTLTGSLYIQGTRQEATAHGNLLVDAAEYTLQNAQAQEVPTLPVTLLHIPAATSEAVIRNKSYPMHLDLDLTAEEHVMVLGRGLKSEWKGNLHLTGTNTRVSLDGELDLVKGEYELFGKTLKLTEGQILFSNKSGSAARMHITGELSLPEATITAYLRGPLTSPTLTLQSNPQMSTSAILARILFNKDISDISQPEALQLATALISLSGGAGPSILETIRKNLGIDRLAIASQTNNPDEIAVQIGKYLTKGIMVTLSQSATSSQIIIEVEFKHGFVFRAETQELQEGKFSLKWTHSY
jgi:autotransporter translocation and assembly factor TamB